MVKKKMSIEDLAVMVQGGFQEVHGHLDGVQAELAEVNKRLDRIENVLIAGHDRRIEKLEDTVRQLVTAVKLKP